MRVLGRLYSYAPDKALSTAWFICGLPPEQRSQATEIFARLDRERKTEAYQDLKCLTEQSPEDLLQGLSHFLLLDGALASSKERGPEAREAMVLAYAQAEGRQDRERVVRAMAAELVERGSLAELEARPVEVNFLEDGLEVGGFLLNN